MVTVVFLVEITLLQVKEVPVLCFVIKNVDLLIPGEPYLSSTLIEDQNVKVELRFTHTFPISGLIHFCSRLLK